MTLYNASNSEIETEFRATNAQSEVKESKNRTSSNLIPNI